MERKFNGAKAAILALALGLSGCIVPGAVTGGGWIPSADRVANHKANFGFSASKCDTSVPPTGSFNYHDKTADVGRPGGVKMTGTLLNAGKCVNTACSTNADCTAFTDGVCDPVTAQQAICLYPGEGFSQCSSDSDCNAASGGSCQEVQLLGQVLGNFCNYPESAGLGVTGCLLCVAAELSSTQLGFQSLPSANTYGFDVYYTSTNPKNPGNGAAEICVIDNGQGANAPAKDEALLFVKGGPYDGYENFGSVRGNISAQSCPWSHLLAVVPDGDREEPGAS